jgi:hypothetical protein
MKLELFPLAKAQQLLLLRKHPRVAAIQQIKSVEYLDSSLLGGKQQGGVSSNEKDHRNRCGPHVLNGSLGAAGL